MPIPGPPGCALAHTAEAALGADKNYAEDLKARKIEPHIAVNGAAAQGQNVS